MCTVILEVPPIEASNGSVRVLAVRDEDPARPWDAPGEWWPELPGVVGVRDRRAGGAWLAVSPVVGRLSVLLNRVDHFSEGLPASSNELRSRGTLVLDSIEGRLPGDAPGTAGFNLVTVEGSRAAVTSWDGERLVREQLEPGVHMIAHHDVDDSRSTRIAQWLPEFRQLSGLGDEWRSQWVSLLDRTTALPVDDDRAIIRDNRSHGYPTLSLLVCTASVSAESVELESATLSEPAVWQGAPSALLRQAAPGLDR